MLKIRVTHVEWTILELNSILKSIDLHKDNVSLSPRNFNNCFDLASGRNPENTINLFFLKSVLLSRRTTCELQWMLAMYFNDVTRLLMFAVTHSQNSLIQGFNKGTSVLFETTDCHQSMMFLYKWKPYRLLKTWNLISVVHSHTSMHWWISIWANRRGYNNIDNYYASIWVESPAKSFKYHLNSRSMDGLTTDTIAVQSQSSFSHVSNLILINSNYGYTRENCFTAIFPSLSY